jgi:hypothetical protein
MQHQSFLFTWSSKSTGRELLIHKRIATFSQPPSKQPTASNFSIHRSQRSNVPITHLTNQLLLQIQVCFKSFIYPTKFMMDFFSECHHQQWGTEFTFYSHLSKEVAAFPLAVASMFDAIFSTYYITSLQI